MKYATETDLRDKIIVVTGASSGLGFAMAAALARANATVILTSKTEANLNAALFELKRQHLDVYGEVMDVRDENSIAETVQWVRKTFRQADMLVNNAGIGMRTVNPDFLTSPQPFFQVSAKGFRDVIDTNLTGYFLVAKAFVPLFLERGRGKIVNVSMNHETMKRKGFVPYGPSRAGAESLSHIMTEDLKGYGVDVNMLLPGGATDTGMIPDHLREGLKEKIKLLSPDIMAGPICYLASDRSNGITGERIVAARFEEWKAQHEHHQQTI
jgi:NAD(P)-dependent dehydrogenase (short-subunit alcohol dehydrogenase family)